VKDQAGGQSGNGMRRDYSQSARQEEPRQGGLDFIFVPASQGGVNNGRGPAGTEGAADRTGKKSSRVSPLRMDAARLLFACQAVQGIGDEHDAHEHTQQFGRRFFQHQGPNCHAWNAAEQQGKNLAPVNMLSQAQREKCGYQDAQEAAERHGGLYVNKQGQQGDCQQAEPETGDSLGEAGSQKYEKQKKIYRHEVRPAVCQRDSAGNPCSAIG